MQSSSASVQSSSLASASPCPAARASAAAAAAFLRGARFGCTGSSFMSLGSNFTAAAPATAASAASPMDAFAFFVLRTPLFLGADTAGITGAASVTASPCRTGADLATAARLPFALGGASSAAGMSGIASVLCSIFFRPLPFLTVFSLTNKAPSFATLHINRRAITAFTIAGMQLCDCNSNWTPLSQVSALTILYIDCNDRSHGRCLTVWTLPDLRSSPLLALP